MFQNCDSRYAKYLINLINATLHPSSHVLCLSTSIDGQACRLAHFQCRVTFDANLHSLLFSIITFQFCDEFDIKILILNFEWWVILSWWLVSGEGGGGFYKCQYEDVPLTLIEFSAILVHSWVPKFNTFCWILIISVYWWVANLLIFTPKWIWRGIVMGPNWKSPAAHPYPIPGWVPPPSLSGIGSKPEWWALCATLHHPVYG